MEQTQAASSPAEVVDVFNGKSPTLAEYNHFRQSGEVPQRFKPEPAESAPAAAPEQTVESEDEESESASESESEQSQEQPQKGSGAEKRIKQLLAEKKELQRKLEAAAKPTQTDPSPAPAAQPKVPQNYQEYRQSFKPSEWIAEYAKRNPQASYEDANAAMADHLLDARDHFRSIEQRTQAEKQALDAKVNDAKERYENFDEIKTSFLAKTISDKGTPLIPVQVLSIINDSDYLADVLYTIGSDEAELAKFVAMAKATPNKAIRYVARVEALIAEELAKPKETPVRGQNGQFQAPEPKKTAAPKPPSPVGGVNARGFDVNDMSLSAEEWARKRNAELAKRKA